MRGRDGHILTVAKETFVSDSRWGLKTLVKTDSDERMSNQAVVERNVSPTLSLQFNKVSQDMS